MCDVSRPFSVTVTGAVHASCGAAQIRSCLQHSTQCMPYKPIHHAFNSTADRLYKRDCLLQPKRLAISISSTFTGTAQQRSRSASTLEHSTISAAILIIITCIFFVPYIASDFYNTLLPTFTIMHRSVSFDRTFGDLTQTCAFFKL